LSSQIKSCALKPNSSLVFHFYFSKKTSLLSKFVLSFFKPSQQASRFPKIYTEKVCWQKEVSVFSCKFFLTCKCSLSKYTLVWCGALKYFPALSNVFPRFFDPLYNYTCRLFKPALVFTQKNKLVFFFFSLSIFFIFVLFLTLCYCSYVRASNFLFFF